MESSPSNNPRLIAAIVASALFMASLDATIIATALPQMAVSFHAAPVDLSLGITIYILVMAAFLPMSTWTADRLGARNVFAGAIVGFAFASALCGLSHNLVEFVGARALQAFFAALMTPVGNLVLLRATAKKDLITVLTISTTPGLVAPVIGPAIGGFIVTFVAWPWVFFLNVPIAVVGVLCVLRFIPNLRGQESKPFDWPGFLLTGAALAGVIYGLDRITAPGRLGWEVWAALIVAGLGIGVLAVRHSLRAAHPLVSLWPLRLITFRTIALTGGALVRIPFRALGFILPLMFQVGLHMSAFQSGLLLLGYNGGDLLLKSVAGQVLRATGFRIALAAGAAVTAVAIAGWALFSTTTPFWVIFAVLALSGAARSVLFTGMVSLVFADVPHERIGDATVLSNLFNQTTGAVAIGMAVVVLNLSAIGRGAAAGQTSLADCRVALVVMALIGLCSLPWFLRLPRDAGAEVSGHQARATA